MTDDETMRIRLGGGAGGLGVPRREGPLLTIYGSGDRRLVSIDQDGLLTYDEDYDPNEAARTFWRCLADASPHQGLVDQLRAALRDARTELARWGWGDMHYGSQGQEQRVVDALAAIDRALGEP